MALLNETEQKQARSAFMQELMSLAETIGLTKAELLAAVAGIDDYLETNAAAMNTAIPQPARGVLTTKQKARLLVAVTRQRYLVT